MRTASLFPNGFNRLHGHFEAHALCPVVLVVAGL